MRTTWKRVVLAALCALFLYAAYIGYQVVRAWRLFKAEDQIAASYGPVVDAIYAYADTHGCPPSQLSDLVPNPLSAIPRCAVVREITFRVGADGKVWRLELRSDAYGEHRIYCWQSDNNYTAEEKQRILGRYHGGWTVMADD